jgi:predicted DNA binding protein
VCVFLYRIHVRVVIGRQAGPVRTGIENMATTTDGPIMATFTEVRFAHEDGALAGTLASLDEVDVRVLPETSTDPRRDMHVLSFDDVEDDTLEAALSADHTVAAVRPMSQFADRTLLGVEFTGDTKLLAPQVTREGGFVVDARSSRPGRGDRGWHERWLLPDREAIHDIWEYAREEGFEFEVLDLTRRGNVDGGNPAREALTDEQREALLTAYEQGYFADPREASLEAVADSLDHSPSAVGGRIKRGMRALVEATLVVDRPRE